MDNEKGMILLTMLLLMVIISLIGIIAINTSIVDIRITGNVNTATTAFEGAEAGIDVSVPIIEDTIINATLTPSAPVNAITSLDTTNLQTEIMGGSSYNPDTPQSPDVSMSDLGGVAVDVDIDYLYSYALEGGSLEFASGYEGIGAGAAGGGVGVLYEIDSQGTKN